MFKPSVKAFGNIGWYTNLPHKKRNEELVLFKTYAGNEAAYPRYDNYDAIEVSKVCDLPVDYAGGCWPQQGQVNIGASPVAPNFVYAPGTGGAPLGRRAFGISGTPKLAQAGFLQTLTCTPS